MIMTKVNGTPWSTGFPADLEYDGGDADGDIVSFVVIFVNMRCEMFQITIRGEQETIQPTKQQTTSPLGNL